MSENNFVVYLVGIGNYFLQPTDHFVLILFKIIMHFVGFYFNMTHHDPISPKLQCNIVYTFYDILLFP